MEIVTEGLGLLVGTDSHDIEMEIKSLIEDQGKFKSMTGKPNPYGTGQAAEEIVAILKRA